MAGKVNYHFEEILALIAGGKTIRAAVAEYPDLNFGTFNWWVQQKSHPERRERMEQAKATTAARAAVREAQSATWVTGGKQGDYDWDGLFAAIRTNPARPVQEICDGGERFPSWSALKRIVIRDPAIGAQYRALMKSTGPQRHSARLAASTPMQLLHGLLQNDLYSQVQQAIPRGFDPELRDDLISEAIAAVLDGSIGVDEVRAHVPALKRLVTSRSFRSLDEVVIDDTLGEMMTTNDMVWGV